MFCIVVLILLVPVVIAGPTTWPPPPKWQQKAEMARYLVHFATWGVVSSIAPEYQYIPFGTLQSFADGPLHHSTGTPYFYIASISDTYKNVQYNNTVSLSLSQEESSYCRDGNLDPEEPLCARVIVYGKMVAVNGGDEEQFAHNCLFERHPAMANWPHSHDWNFYKIDLLGVCLLDYYGGATHVPLKDYFDAYPSLDLPRPPLKYHGGEYQIL